MKYQVGEIITKWTDETGHDREEIIIGLFTIETSKTNMGEFYAHREEAKKLNKNAVFYNTATVEWDGATPYIYFN